MYDSTKPKSSCITLPVSVSSICFPLFLFFFLDNLIKCQSNWMTAGAQIRITVVAHCLM